MEVHMTKFRMLTVATAVAALSAVALASVSFDPVTGTGFVGKGEVQLVYSWNNSTLQRNADSVQFAVNSTTVTEYTWTCDRDAGPQTQERARTTTTTMQGLVEAVARERNQVTGFLLLGYDGSPSTTTESEGNQLWSCPTGWTSTNESTVGPTPVSGGGLLVSIDGSTWESLE
jgi:hypothetical protein